MSEFQVTKWHASVFGDGRDRITSSDYTTQEHPIEFSAYDADEILYCDGTCADADEAAEAALDYLKDAYGVTDLRLFDRRTGESRGTMP